MYSVQRALSSNWEVFRDYVPHSLSLTRRNSVLAHQSESYKEKYPRTGKSRKLWGSSTMRSHLQRTNSFQEGAERGVLTRRPQMRFERGYERKTWKGPTWTSRKHYRKFHLIPNYPGSISCYWRSITSLILAACCTTTLRKRTISHTARKKNAACSGRSLR